MVRRIREFRNYLGYIGIVKTFLIRLLSTKYLKKKEIDLRNISYKSGNYSDVQN